MAYDKYPPLEDHQQKLVVENIKIVPWLVRRMKLRAEDDLVSVGYIGLCIAAIKFEPDRGIKFASYAAWWIRAVVLQYETRGRSVVSVATSEPRRKVFFNLSKAQKALNTEDPRKIARYLNVEVDDVKAVSALMSGDASIDYTFERDGRSPFEPVDSAPRPEEQVAEVNEQQRAREHFERAMVRLNPRERAVMRARYLRDDPTMLADLAREFGLSRERVRQIEIGALKKLRESFLDDGWWRD
jgi:RNA polymerase sigma-32 factor